MVPNLLRILPSIHNRRPRRRKSTIYKECLTYTLRFTTEKGTVGDVTLLPQSGNGYIVPGVVANGGSPPPDPPPNPPPPGPTPQVVNPPPPPPTTLQTLVSTSTRKPFAVLTVTSQKPAVATTPSPPVNTDNTALTVNNSKGQSHGAQIAKDGQFQG